jgi:hypothetical protein
MGAGMRLRVFVHALKEVIRMKMLMRKLVIGMVKHLYSAAQFLPLATLDIRIGFGCHVYYHRDLRLR